MTQTDFKHLGLAVIETELAAVNQLKSRIVVTGMGKSGHIAGKIAATLASTGSPAFFVHPGEAGHGDLGMITSKDVVLARSNSGNTTEILTIVPIIKRLGVPLICMTGNPNSPLATEATINLDVGVEKEACPLGLAPTSSTTVALVMGDALAVALLEARGFTEEDFALSHPGGSLGRRLLLHVSDIMHSGDDMPRVTPGVSISEALLEMSSKGMGMTAIVDDSNRVLGIYTDGDLRRTLDRKIDLQHTPIDQVMTRNCKTVDTRDLAAGVLRLMEDHKINGVLVTDSDNRLIGALNMHDLLRAGVM